MYAEIGTQQYLVEKNSLAMMEIQKMQANGIYSSWFIDQEVVKGK